MDQQKTQRTTVVGPYVENSDLMLTCQVFGGKYYNLLQIVDNMIVVIRTQSNLEDALSRRMHPTIPGF